VLRITQLRKWKLSALNVSVCGIGFAASSARPELLPGHAIGLLIPALGRLVSKPPAPPP
jgi:hypothetical protein